MVGLDSPTSWNRVAGPGTVARFRFQIAGPASGAIDKFSGANLLEMTNLARLRKINSPRIERIERIERPVAVNTFSHLQVLARQA